MTAIKAITTVYKGYKFRSRLEARWAVVFDTLGVKWEYEKEGFDLGDGVRYLPDFWLPDFAYWVEVKGGECPVSDIEKMGLLRLKTHQEVVLVGNIPEEGAYPGVATVYPKEYDLIDGDEGKRRALRVKMFHDKDFSDMSAYCPLCNGPSLYLEFTDVLCDGRKVRVRGLCQKCGFWCALLIDCEQQGFDFYLDEACDYESDFLNILVDRNYELRDSALRAGRQARFEHGEKG